MVEQHTPNPDASIPGDPPNLDAIFHALGDSTRRKMLRTLADGPRTLGQLSGPFAISFAAVSKHVKVLEAAGLIRREVNWRTHTCHLDGAALAAAHGWLADYERFWTGRLDDLERLLREETAQIPDTKGENP